MSKQYEADNGRGSASVRRSSWKVDFSNQNLPLTDVLESNLQPTEPIMSPRCNIQLESRNDLVQFNFDIHKTYRDQEGTRGIGYNSNMGVAQNALVVSLSNLIHVLEVILFPIPDRLWDTSLNKVLQQRNLMSFPSASIQ